MMKQKLFTLFVALVATTALWAQNNVITYTATEKLPETMTSYSGGLHINAFNVAISSHSFSNGIGTITFKGEVTTIGDKAFSGCSGLTSITIPNSVTTIGAWSFSDCSGLTSVTISNSVTTIGDYAFYKCKSLTLVTIPNSVKVIGESVFRYCSGLTSVTIGDAVTTIGYGAFCDCSGLTSITIPSSVTTIGNYAFERCTGLISINVDAANTHYCSEDDVLFNYVKDTLIQYPVSNIRTEYSIPSSVTTIERSAFYQCKGLTSITIPNSVTTIGAWSFSDCSGLTSVTIPNSVTEIGEVAFDNVNNIVYNGTVSGSPWGAKCMNGYIDGHVVYSDETKTTLCGCSGVATGEITIPNSVTTIREGAFSGCSGLTSVIWNAKNFKYSSVNFYESMAPFYHIRSQITSFVFGDEIEVIPRYLCYGMNNLTSVTISNSVTTIEDYAFENCSSLTSVTIPNSVIFIGRSFGYCNGLERTYYIGTIADWCRIRFSDENSNPISFSHNLYINDVEIKDLVIPEGVNTIGDYAFSGCSGLTSVTIPNSITEIGYNAFDGCEGLKKTNYIGTIADWCKIKFSTSSNPIYYSRNLYINDVEVKDLVIPEGVNKIGDYAFFGCSGLTSVTIPNSVSTIGWYVFSGCIGLTSITIPNSVTQIESSAFENCSGLTSVIWKAKNFKYSSERTAPFFYIRSQITSFVFGDEIKVIPSYLCCRMNNLTSITIPNSITEIENDAFNGCSGLTTIDIPNSVTTIKSSAFSDCSGLTSVTIPNSIITIDYYAFNRCRSIEKVYVTSSYYPFEGTGVSSIITNAFTATTPQYILQYEAQISTNNATPTCAFVHVNLSKMETSQYAQMALDFAGVKHELSANENSVILTGLTPASTNKATFYSQLIGESEWREGATIEITTPELTLTTLNPKVVSAGTAVVAAETNISDYETNVGFEWRKTDAPPTLPSKSGAAVVCNGMMEGRLLNLGTNAYWDVRPYYTAADGTSYYGEWITFDPSDFSYFEPTVHTYALATSPTSNSVQVRGYVMTGTDEVTEQGFEYWINSAKAPNRVSSATSEDVHRVKASGQLMTAVLENLAYSSTYTCRAYALAGGKTYYGEEVQFLTPETPTGLFDVLMNNDAQQATKFMHNGQLYILRDGNLYNATGARVK